MKNYLVNLIKCPNCNNCLEIKNSLFSCPSCDFKQDTNKILRYVDGKYHENWGLQWNKFSKVQLDSYNGTNESESRLLLQTKLQPKDFKDKVILEVGSGNGRFTEILLKYGAKVITVDYSIAINANKNNNEKFEDVIFLQADLFKLPVSFKSFDIVICFGVIQHTGNNVKAINELFKFPSSKGLLAIDIYSNSFKFYNPWIYIIRPIFLLLKLSQEKKFSIISKFVKFIFPFQFWILSKIHNKKGILKIIKYIINRSPNSVYGINLHLSKKISKELALNWSIMDTFDSYAATHDHPVSKKKWKFILSKLGKENRFKVLALGESGQGNFAILQNNIINLSS